MRLIDADKLKETIEEEKDDNDYMCRLCLESIKEIIDEQPTVFDVDKISKELVKRKKIVNKKMNESDDTYSMSYYDGFSSGLAIAIGIVKGGGVE